jgi:hypothetical protein
MFLCRPSLLKSKNLYFNLVSSGYSNSPNTGNGKSSAFVMIFVDSIKTSISPVLKLLFIKSASLDLTFPTI